MSQDTVNTAEIERTDEVASDVVCGTVVDLDLAGERDLVVEFEDREYAFCGGTCYRRFLATPEAYAIAGRSRP